uniref:General transcription factor III repeat domaincontaining protein 2like [Oreochromis niloticus] n=2 Tax=Lepeophtheirus salmonis TaxID=72036 RepID=A0A0K2UI18_LEPSM
MLRGRKKVIPQFYNQIKAFKLKLGLWETQMESGDCTHFLCLRNMCEERHNTDLKRYKDKIAELMADFKMIWGIW